MKCENKKCNKEHDGSYGSGRFCSRSCANSREPITDFKIAVCSSCNSEFKIKKQASSKNYVCKDCKEHTLVCKKCNKEFKSLNKHQQFCSRDCQRKYNVQDTDMSTLGGIASAKSRCLRSKDEIKLFELCDDFYDCEVTHNEAVVEGYSWDADIIIRDLKIAILWNGPWHYREMNIGNHSLKQVQNRDKIKTKLFKENGWTVYIFEDREYTPETAIEYLKNL